MAAHTPGPWRLQDDGDEGWTIRLGEHRAEHFGDKDDEGLANLRLMAAALDLLEACRLAMNDMEEMAYSVVTYSAVKAAWEKATGLVAS